MIDREQLRADIARVIDGDAEGIAFHGPSTKSNLSGITSEQAAARPIAAGHSIWELMAHLKVGREWSLIRMKGEKPDVNWWPAISSQTSADWRALLSELDEVQARIFEGLESAQDEDARHALRFLVHHELYHSGQIALVRRALGLPGRPG